MTLIAFLSRAVVAFVLSRLIIRAAIRVIADACERLRLPTATARARRRAEREQRLDITPALRRAAR